MLKLASAFAAILLLIPCVVYGDQIADAQQVFARFHNSVYQIRVIDNATNNKAVTGTGFLVDKRGLIATNYHVIAATLNVPDKYRIEVQVNDDHATRARLVNVDIVNDLALLKINPPHAAPLTLATAPSLKGDTVYSIGYPYDIGITVVPGTYNGLAPHSVNSKVNFTGSLNPGMSGGPAFNQDGEVIGINEATAGNQVSFLVPVRNLIHLIKQTPPGFKGDFEKIIVQQLEANSKRMITDLLDGNWQTVPLGGAHALDEVTPFLRCWGDSKDQTDPDDNTPFWAQRSCQTDHNIFVSEHHTTGNIALQFYWISSKHLNQIQFYNYYQRIFAHYRPDNAAGKQDVGNWACNEDFVTVHSGKAVKTKAVFCARAYKHFKGIYDVLFLQGSVNKKHQAYMIHFTIAGTTKQLALEFTKRFMEAGIW